MESNHLLDEENKNCIELVPDGRDWISLLAEMDTGIVQQNSHLNEVNIDDATRNEQENSYMLPNIDVWMDSDEQQLIRGTGYIPIFETLLDAIDPTIEIHPTDRPPIDNISHLIQINENSSKFPANPSSTSSLSNLQINISDIIITIMQAWNNRIALPLRYATSSLLQPSLSCSSAALQAALLNITRYVASHPHMLTLTERLLDLKGVTIESAQAATDRLTTYGEKYIRIPLTADDPESCHVRALTSDPSWEGLPLRCSLAFLTWSQLRLVDADSSQHSAFREMISPSVTASVGKSTVPAALWSYLLDLYDGMVASSSDSATHLAAQNHNITRNVNETNNRSDNTEADDDQEDDDISSLFQEPWIDETSSDPSSGIANIYPHQRGDQWWLATRAQQGDVEAQYALTRWFSPPDFHVLSNCEVCNRGFGPRLFRHHCRMCGRSLCNSHSSERRTIIHLGFTEPVRCCYDCSFELDREAHFNQLYWRELRVRAYLSGALLPYTSPLVDTRVDKVLRVVDCSIAVAKKTVVFNYPAYLFLETVNILRRYGMSGLAGVLLRKDFLDAVETLKRISGVDDMFKMSLHELTACIYYKLAIDRGVRGCDPDGEKILHDEHIAFHYGHGSSRFTDLTSQSKTNYEASLEFNSEAINSIVKSSSNQNSDMSIDGRSSTSQLLSDLNEAVRLAPLALQAVYGETAEECQRLAASQGWRTIFCCTESAPEQPAYALFASDYAWDTHLNNSNKNQRKEVILAIRGTSSVHDMVTDIRSAPHIFPPDTDEVDDAFRGAYRPKDPVNKYGMAQTIHSGRRSNTASALTQDGQISQIRNGHDSEDVGHDYEPVTVTQWEWTRDLKDKQHACRGMAVSSLWLMSQVAPSLLTLAAHGYSVVLTGHSLGGGVAALLTYLLKSRLPTVRAVVFGCPSCVDSKTADLLDSRVLSVILRDDFISRVTPQSIRQLMRELLLFRSQVFRHLEQDWRDVTARVGSLWSPRWRDSVRSVPHHAPPLAVTAKPTLQDDTSNSSSILSCQQTAVEATSSSGRCLSETAGGEAEGTDNEGSEVMVGSDTDSIAELWLPGRLLHLYSYRGQYRVSPLHRTYPSLRRIEVQGNLFADHTSEDIFDALLEARAVLTAPSEPPPWTPYDRTDRCECCSSVFTWHSTFRGEAQEYREKYNCRQCGSLVCDPCSSRRRPIPRLGLIFPSRICDRCFFKGDYAYPG